MDGNTVSLAHYTDLQEQPEVAVTIVDPTDNSSLQAQGKAKVIDDAPLIELVLSKMTHIYVQGADRLPPITKIRAGAYQVVGVKVKQARLANYQGFSPGDKRIFKEL